MGKHKQQNTGQADASAQPREGATWAVHRVFFPPHSPHAAPRASQLPPPNFQVLLSTRTSWKEQGKGRGKGGAKNFLSALFPRACWWSLPGQADERMRLWAKQGTHLFSEQKWEGCRQQTLRRESCSKSGGWQHVSTASQPGDGSHHGRRHLPQEPRRSSRNSPCARH